MTLKPGTGPLLRIRAVHRLVPTSAKHSNGSMCNVRNVLIAPMRSYALQEALDSGLHGSQLLLVCARLREGRRARAKEKECPSGNFSHSKFPKALQTVLSSVTSALPAALPVDVRTIEGNGDNVKPVSTSEASDVNTMVTTYCFVVQDTNVEKSETMKVCDAYLWLLRSQLSHEPLLTEHGSLSH